MKHCGLVADAGGTNVRFALGEPDDAGGAPVLRAPKKYASKEFPGIVEAARAYLADVGGDAAPREAVFAVAGPVRDGTIDLTNLGWNFSEGDLCSALGVARAALVNDFEAIALSVPHLAKTDLVPIGPVMVGREAERETFAIVGPGTGLGVSGCTRGGGGIVVPLVGEGGHADFAPADDVEIAILGFLRERFGHVSAERILCGPGLVNLHEALAEIEGVPYEKISSREITARAREHVGSFCARVFERFCAILGSVAGNAALVMGARGGVLIAGGILPAMAQPFAASSFRERFEAKGRFQGYMKDIPTSLIVQDYAGLIGAAASLRAMR